MESRPTEVFPFFREGEAEEVRVIGHDLLDSKKTPTGGARTAAGVF